MTQQLRDAAQALINATLSYHSMREQDIGIAARELQAVLSAPPPSADEAVKELLQLVEGFAACVMACQYADAASKKDEIQAHGRQMLLSAQGDARTDWRTTPPDLYKLLDIAAHHFTEGRYGWPSKWTQTKLLEHWRAGKPTVSDVFAVAPTAPVSPEPATPDEVIELACALEQRRALHIVAEVAALQIGGAARQTPTPFQAGYALACEEIETRLRTQQWELVGVPAPLPPPAGSEA